VILEAPNLFFRDWVASHYLETLRPYTDGREVQIVTASEAHASSDLATSLAAALNASRPPAPTPAPVASTAQPPWEHGLNLKFTFDRFVVGPSNRFAHAASMAVAESPAKAYNPLFIYGGVGLGKTHLMQAIGQAILFRWANRRVVYLSSERFTNELITAIQTKTTTRFRERYRTVDVLLIDDIHFIAEKEATQEEFFHTFNALYDAHKQIVMSSDRSPKEIAGLEERLVSRFEWGLVTDIQPPDLETRIAILRKKAEEAQVEVPNEVTAFIAQQITSNIRELEGALIRVIAYCNLFNKPRTAATAREVLKDMVREVSARVSLEEIQRRVASYFHIDLNELRGAKRQRSILYPRQVAMFLCRKLTEASLPEIGNAFGGRDHTTVMHAVEKIERESAQDLHKKQAIEQLRQLLLNASRGLR
jgi:chromosomal replication initiator protein